MICQYPVQVYTIVQYVKCEDRMILFRVYSE